VQVGTAGGRLGGGHLSEKGNHSKVNSISLCFLCVFEPFVADFTGCHEDTKARRKHKEVYFFHKLKYVWLSH
jgi:hypothetical protein